MACEHLTVDEARTPARKLFAFICRRCLAVLCPACKRLAVVRDDAPTENLPPGSFCRCRPFTGGASADDDLEKGQ